jgi:hypothetical protein
MIASERQRNIFAVNDVILPNSREGRVCYC